MYAHTDAENNAATMNNKSYHHANSGNTNGTGNSVMDRYKTRPCNKFTAQGFCPYEERCMFAHGEEELRTREMNIRDGFTSEEAIKLHQRHLRYERLAAEQMQQQYGHTMPTANVVEGNTMNSPSVPAPRSQQTLARQQSATQSHHDSSASDGDNSGRSSPSSNQRMSHNPYNNNMAMMMPPQYGNPTGNPYYYNNGYYNSEMPQGEEQYYYNHDHYNTNNEYLSSEETEHHHHQEEEQATTCKTSSLTPDECVCDACEKKKAAARRSNNALRKAFAP